MPSTLTKNRTKLFIRKYGKDIATAIAGTGLYFSAVVGQKCGESAYGTSDLAVKYNNFGGIRGATRESSGVTSRGWAIFPTPLACFKSYARFITQKPQYQKALRATSPEQQILELVKAGYCETSASFTANDYLKLCQGAIDSARLIAPIGRVTDLYASINLLESSNI
jgi:flagellum-specific peptidoglycan hydrolase FlgJ